MSMKKILIDRYVEARGVQEHWVERLPGGPAHSEWRATPPGSFSSSRTPGGYYYTFGGRSWDIGRRSLEDLERLVQGFRETLITAARAGEPLGQRAIPQTRRKRRRR
jgi:hypothetical protein